ncbi:ribonuclease R family protein [Pajaroellobacter abortibovis]|uniref:Ribonuclease R n=1 Tax=Pajaroellobacter abortibovis TaxID=1882918 RepID=A0A1L6MYW1_9BACT|nr:VacB/RNase II family 3'-5' exoribonuclease [Pajaroellobacter abortibovis]APS00618.1 hypothetical protein BCY86_07990 [Pajaroellobacter abortibovis]
MATYSISKSRSLRRKDEPLSKKKRRRKEEKKRIAYSEQEGILSMNPKGFGFVSKIHGKGGDIFIPPSSIGGALHGDRVLVRSVIHTHRGEEGDILQIVERGAKLIVGTLYRSRKLAWIEPDDTRMPHLYITPSEKGKALPSIQEGSAATARITHYPEFTGDSLQGTLETILGPTGELKVEVAKLLAMEQIEENHSPQAIQEAKAYGTIVSSDLLEGREDLTHLPFLTIDPQDARDHDDAIWIESQPNGWRVWIAIADVSTYVRPGTHLDEEAKQRGCTIYLPDRAVPMLPVELSAHLCSLLPDVNRLSLCVEATLTPQGKVTSFRVVRGLIRVRAKLTYEGAARALSLSTNPSPEPQAEAFKDALQVAYQLSQVLRQKRQKRGALDFEVPEAKIVLDPKTGYPIHIERRTQDSGLKKAHQLVEEFMLLANEIVAEWIISQEFPTLFRIHLPPDRIKLEKLTAWCEMLGLHVKPEDFEEPLKASQLINSFADHPMATLLSMLFLRSMKQASYHTENVGHFGLALTAYLHFTSPIRRYPDLVAHRTVHALLSNHPLSVHCLTQETLAQAAILSSSAERRAISLERDITDLYRAQLMQENIGETFEGMIASITSAGIYVELDSPFATVFVRSEDLGTGKFTADEGGLWAKNRRTGEVVTLGDRITVQILDISLSRRTIYGKKIQNKKKKPSINPFRNFS